jgi:hypothetical protein
LLFGFSAAEDGQAAERLLEHFGALAERVELAQAGSQRQPLLCWQMIASPLLATPDMPWSRLGQDSPAW